MSGKVLLAWSGGKDSALALHELKKDGEWEIAALLTTVTEDYGRVSMHGIRAELIRAQADSLDLPLARVEIPADCSNDEYGRRMQCTLEQFQAKGIEGVVFGDIFLEDLRKYREDNLASIGMKGMFPIWKRETKELAREFVDLGFRGVITCVDSKYLDGGFVGREYDAKFLADLPDDVDPCGENGEFHTFVFDGPIFSEPVPYSKGSIVFREDRFYFCDLLPQ